MDKELAIKLWIDDRDEYRRKFGEKSMPTDADVFMHKLKCANKLVFKPVGVTLIPVSKD